MTAAWFYPIHTQVTDRLDERLAATSNRTATDVMMDDDMYAQGEHAQDADENQQEC